MSGTPRKKWILVVEDDMDVIETFTETLVSQGYKVVSCTNSLDAFRVLTNQQFDAVLLDMRLERSTGDQIVDFMRRDPKGFNHGTPILVISGELNPELVSKIKTRVQGFFVKPFDLKAVVAKIVALSGEA